MIVQTSWDDGSQLDMRLAQMLLNYNIPAIFFLPSRCRELDDGQVVELAENFTIGSHTVNHERLTRVKDKAKIWCEIFDAKTYFENLLQKPCELFCYPRGWYNDEIKGMVKDAGYKYARTTRIGYVTDGARKDPYEWHTTVHFYPHRKEQEVNTNQELLDYAKAKFDEAYDIDGYFHLWGHTNELQKYDSWYYLLELFKYIKDRI